MKRRRQIDWLAGDKRFDKDLFATAPRAGRC